MLDGTDNSYFGAFKDNLDKNMTCGSESYPKSKDKTVGLINNYHEC